MRAQRMQYDEDPHDQRPRAHCKKENRPRHWLAKPCVCPKVALTVDHGASILQSYFRPGGMDSMRSISLSSRRRLRRLWAFVLLVCVTTSLCMPHLAAGAIIPETLLLIDAALAFIHCPPKTSFKLQQVQFESGDVQLHVFLTIPPDSGSKASTITFYSKPQFLYLDVAAACHDELEEREKDRRLSLRSAPRSLVIDNLAADDSVFVDLNGDGVLDVAMANRDANTVAILLAKPDKTFERLADVPAGIGPMRIVAGDFNKDGK